MQAGLRERCTHGTISSAFRISHAKVHYGCGVKGRATSSPIIQDPRRLWRVFANLRPWPRKSRRSASTISTRCVAGWLCWWPRAPLWVVRGLRPISRTLIKACGLRSFRQRLLEDGRLKKISKEGHFALRSWSQYDEYTGIAEEIAEEIERQGGAAKAQYLIETLSERYGVKASSVAQYLSAPMFIKSNNNLVRVRQANEILRLSADPSTCPGLYWVEGQWCLRVEINDETLRGSGRPMNSSAAVVIGCQPGDRKTFKSPRDAIVVSWPIGSAGGPNLGSIKPDVDALGGHVGDLAFLCFGPDDVTVRLLQQHELMSAPPMTRLLLMLGLNAVNGDGSDRWAAIANALGLGKAQSNYDPDDIHAALMRKNEVALANLIQDQTNASKVHIFDRLQDILGL